MFFKDESGSITVEAVLWFSFLTGVGIAVGSKIIEPLVARASEQAALNQESLDLINAAVSACTP